VILLLFSSISVISVINCFVNVLRKQNSDKHDAVFILDLYKNDASVKTSTLDHLRMNGSLCN